MLFPVYVHVGDKDHAHGVTIPDLPGCFSAADEWEDLPRMVQEAVELYFEGEEMEIPEPTALDKLMEREEYQGGAWLMVDIDEENIHPKTVRLNISMPESLVRKVDGYAKAHHLSRSAFLAKAAQEAMEDRG